LTFERTLKNKKGNSWSTIDTKNMLPSKLSSIHKVTRDALDVSIINMEDENIRIKERVKELEETLMPPPILATPVSMIQPDKTLQGTPESNMRVKGISILMIATRHFVEENIKKKMALVLDLWDLEKWFSTRAQNSKH
jgi:hypothetical protein